MPSTRPHPNHPQPTQWSLRKGMSMGIEEIRHSLESGTGKLNLGFMDQLLTKEAGR
jgi:hypothetical protein